MRACWFFGLTSALVWSCALSVNAATLDGPLAPAAGGRVQCYAPDAVRKTCRSMATYRVDPTGGIVHTAIVLVSQKPAITVQTAGWVEIKAGQVCGSIRREDLETASFAVDDKPLDAGQAADLRQQMETAMKDVVGKEVCTSYVPAGSGFMAKATVGGVAQSADQTVIWVAPSDGYRVAP
jgi:hypothetical protein